MNSLEKLQQIFDPFEKGLMDINNAPINDRMQKVRTESIILLLKSFKDSPIEIIIKEANKQRLMYEIYWVDRKKYFKVLKKELINFFDRFIKIIHSKNLHLIDIRLQENRKMILLIERSDK